MPIYLTTVIETLEEQLTHTQKECLRWRGDIHTKISSKEGGHKQLNKRNSYRERRQAHSISRMTQAFLLQFKTNILSTKLL